MSSFHSGTGSFVGCSICKPLIDDPNKKPGDIDLALCCRDEPFQAIAVQAKAVKVTAISWEEDKVNRLPDLKDAVAQANRTRELGFYQTYLVVLILSDARERRHHNIPARKATEGSFQRIWEFPGRENLHESIGLAFVEVVQPTERGIDFMATVAAAIAREPKSQEQRPSLTDKVRLLIAMRPTD